MNNRVLLKEIVISSNNPKFVIYKDDIFKITWFSDISIMPGRGLIKKTVLKGLNFKDENYKNMKELEVYNDFYDCVKNLEGGNKMKEEYIKPNENVIAVSELRALHDLSSINKMLTVDEYFKIIMIYNKAIDRINQEAIEQGIEV